MNRLHKFLLQKGEQDPLHLNCNTAIKRLKYFEKEGRKKFAQEFHADHFYTYLNNKYKKVKKLRIVITSDKFPEHLNEQKN